MKFHEFAKLISEEQNPTILVEGRRTVPADTAATAGRLAGHLAERITQFEADPAAIIPLPATGMRKSSEGSTVRVVIRAGDGLT